MVQKTHMHNPKFNYTACLTSDDHNSLILNLNYTKFVFELNSRCLFSNEINFT